MSLRLTNFIKAHAYGNDFLFIDEGTVSADDAAGIATRICHRHSGVGADGLIFYRITAAGAAMKLFNADGSVAEVSGNGVRCLAAIVADDDEVRGETVIESDGGIKVLKLLKAVPPRYTFRAFMGAPIGLQETELDVTGERVRVVVMSVGNPQCIVLTDRLDEARFRRLGPALATHEVFPDGTNVEFVQVERSDRAKVLIWERGVGPTSSSGTGACASAVAASAFGGASRSLDVVSPGGSQHVDWRDDGIYLTGWAEITVRGEWFVEDQL
jgi:diaminopimelate epimerase